jgi:hypothetical protein
LILLVHRSNWLQSKAFKLANLIMRKGYEMITIEHLPRNSVIFTAVLILIIPLHHLKATTIEYGTNLIENGNAELGDGSNGYVYVDVPGWTRLEGGFTAVSYGTTAFPGSESPGPDDRGNNFFSGGNNYTFSSAFQIIDVSDLAVEIDMGTVNFNLSGYFGGYYDHEDNATLTVLFHDDIGNVLGSAAIGQVSVSDRDTITGLLFRDTQGFLPTETRQIEVLLEMNRVHGSYNDGYTDNLSLVLVPLPSTIILLGTGILAMRRYQRISRIPRHSPVNK